jgi:hypothetical protein
MPFNIRNLVPIGGQSRNAPAGTGEATGGVGNGAFTFWLYRTEDAANTVDAAGYFNGARGLLTPNDVILRMTVNATGVVQTAGFHIVNDVPALPGNIDVTDPLALVVTDTR